MPRRCAGRASLHMRSGGPIRTVTSRRPACVQWPIGNGTAVPHVSASGVAVYQQSPLKKICREMAWGWGPATAQVLAAARAVVWTTEIAVAVVPLLITKPLHAKCAWTWPMAMTSLLQINTATTPMGEISPAGSVADHSASRAQGTSTGRVSSPHWRLHAGCRPSAQLPARPTPTAVVAAA